MMKVPEIDFDPADPSGSAEKPWIVRGYTGTNLPAPPLGVYADLEAAKKHHPAARLTVAAQAEMERLKRDKTRS